MPRGKAGEYVNYSDQGCVIKTGPSSCLACPRSICVLDEPPRPPQPTAENIAHAKRRARIRALIAEGKSWEVVMATLNVSRMTVSKAVKEGRNNG